MASMQCQRSHQEITCETKCHENNSFGHKLSDVAGKVFKGNHHGHHASSNHSNCYGQTQTHGHPHTDLTMTKTQTQTQTHQTYCPDHNTTLTKTQSATHCAVSQPHGRHGQNGHHMTSCYGKTEKKMKIKCEHKKKKEKCHCNNKHRSDNSSDSDSD